MLRTLVALACLVCGQPLDAQAPRDQEAGNAGGPSLLLVDTETRVESVGFRFLSGTALPEDALLRQIATRGPGPLTGIQDALDFIPGIPSATRPLFSPLALQKDVARLRDQYRRAGFLEVAVDYAVMLDTTANRVEIDFVVDQGLPLVLDSVWARIATDAPATDPLIAEPTRDPQGVPPELESAWSEHLRRLLRYRGLRLGETQRAQIELETAHWFLDRGYPWATVTSAAGDTTDHAVDLELVAMPGPRARVDEIVLEGNRRLSDRVIRREVPIGAGDWYSENDVAAGESELYELELIRRALGGPAPQQPRDSTVTLQYRVEETLPRQIWGRAGWRSEAGLSGEAHWTHRNFLGGARTLTTSAEAETGWAALERAQGRSLGVSANVRQPYLGHTRISGTFGPFLRLRDDFRDRSLVYGAATAAIYKAGALETITLQHEISRLQVEEALQLLPVEELVARGGEPLSPAFVRNVLTLSGSYGSLDDRINPSLGFLVKPSLEVAAPGELSDVEYFRLALETIGALPITRRIGVFVRAEGGRLFPFGGSDPENPADVSRAAVGLRSAMFTAGGTGDVRGWGNGMLGPKIPRVRISPTEPVGADRYLPVGGLARLIGSVELVLPFPFVGGSHRTFVFLDAGRVWSPGDRFQPPDPELAISPWGVGTGFGAQIATPVGPLRASVGYKLNPSRVDLLAPGDVTRALVAGESLSSLPTESVRRWHLHIAIGRSL